MNSDVYEDSNDANVVFIICQKVAIIDSFTINLLLLVTASLV